MEYSMGTGQDGLELNELNETEWNRMEWNRLERSGMN